jgi:bifunctional UDP-N-acetylglucosamine pyrophosphorylase / glucosamine-1-phosphate N-acetyltransferase
MEEACAIAILAAGLGTRLKSKRAKVLHSVGGKTLIEHAARTAGELSSGLRHSPIFVIVGHQADAVIELLNRAKPGLQFIHQREQLGTGHALLCGADQLRTAAPHLLVFYGDTPLIQAATLRVLADIHLRSKASATILTAELNDPTGYGRMVRDRNNEIAAIVEHKSASTEQLAIHEINTGIYCFETRDLFAQLERLSPDPITGEFYLTDVIGMLKAQDKRVAAHKLADASEIIGINNRAELAEVDALLRNRKARELMLSGVTILRPETVQIDDEVQVGTDTVIEPGVSLLGSTRIAGNCRIGSFSIISNSEIGEDVTVHPSCLIDHCTIAPGAGIGPFARLRMHAEIGPDVKIGNFVEVKKSRIGRGSKAQHLSYLGDATIGEGVNVGAGTITCNYDGVNKNPTYIEDGVFIGSNSALVAPVRVGRNAYVGAGSTITQDVPEDSLAIARGHQVTKHGWVKDRKHKTTKPKPVG